MVILKTKIYFCLNVNGDLQVKAKPLHGMGEDLNRMAYVLFSFCVEAHNHGNPRMYVILIT